jgi:hypothetical protein
MRKLVAIAAAGAMLGGAALSSTTSLAAAKRHTARHPAPYYPVDNGGCYRWGETGYHWYNFCIGPAWLYPHQRVCRRNYCWYQ